MVHANHAHIDTPPRSRSAVVPPHPTHLPEPAKFFYTPVVNNPTQQIVRKTIILTVLNVSIYIYRAVYNFSFNCRLVFRSISAGFPKESTVRRPITEFEYGRKMAEREPRISIRI